MRRGHIKVVSKVLGQIACAYVLEQGGRVVLERRQGAILRSTSEKGLSTPSS